MIRIGVLEGDGEVTSGGVSVCVNAVSTSAACIIGAVSGVEETFVGLVGVAGELAPGMSGVESIVPGTVKVGEAAHGICTVSFTASRAAEMHRSKRRGCSTTLYVNRSEKELTLQIRSGERFGTLP